MGKQRYRIRAIHRQGNRNQGPTGRLWIRGYVLCSSLTYLPSVALYSGNFRGTISPLLVNVHSQHGTGQNIENPQAIFGIFRAPAESLLGLPKASTTNTFIATKVCRL